jgi:hypothetical protein
MQTSPLLEDPQRIFRAAIMNGVTPPPVVVAQLEARGVNVGELETRLRQSLEPKH